MDDRQQENLVHLLILSYLRLSDGVDCVTSGSKWLKPSLCLVGGEPLSGAGWFSRPVRRSVLGNIQQITISLVSASAPGDWDGYSKSTHASMLIFKLHFESIT